MKLLFPLFLLLSFSVYAQFDIDLKKKIEKKVNKELNDATDDAINETAETIKKGGEGEDENENASTENPTIDNNSNTNNESNSPSEEIGRENREELKLWSKYDFVAGEKVIFEDDLSGEESGEFPSR